MLNTSIFSLKKRLLAIFVLVSFIFVAIMIRLAYLQLIKGDWLQIKAMDQWTRDLPLKALRGEIYDANGATIATSYSTYDIYVRPSMVENPKEVAIALSTTLSLDYDKVFSRVTDRFVSENLIKMQVDKETALSFKKDELRGIMLSENNTRYYPYKNLLTQVLGFTTVDNIGQAGLEAYYDKYLTGVNGYVMEESDVKGVKLDNTLSTYVPSIAGANLELTIDINIQKFLENALSSLMQEQMPKSASGMIMNPKTGEILAMATLPNFDLNNVPRDNVTALMDMVRNVCVVDIYEPGSTFKCLTMANAIDEGFAHLNETFYDPGYRMVDGEKIKCWKLTGHGYQTLSEGLCNSCNSVFIDLSLRHGKEQMYEMFKKFGFGEKLGIDFLGEANGILMDSDSAKTVDVARMGFGQAVAVSPLQLITAVCSILNGGNLYKPYLVKSVTSTDGVVLSKNEPSILKKTVSEETSKIMREMMLDVIKQYSGYYAFIPGYEVSGKTGTTEKMTSSGKTGEYIASFVGAFPANDPDYVMLIIADEPGGVSYYGSIVATPYAKLIINDIIKYKNYQPTTDIEEEISKLNKKVNMPNLIGKDIYEAVEELEAIGLQVEIQGDNKIVTNQFPIVDTEVSINSIVMIETSN